MVAGAAAIASSGFVGAPAGAGVSRHARASSRAVRMMAYKVPEATQEEWVRGQSGLYEKRISYLGQEIDDLVINQIISVMLFADAEDDTKEQYLYINSPGGSVIAGLALYDTFGHIGSPVITCNIGMAASMASFILGAGERGKRMALPHSRVMIHQPMGGSEGQAEDVRVEAEQIMRIKNTLVTMYAQMTGQTREKLISDLDRDNYMSAQQALGYGLIDKVITGDDS
jgi:ATP-dependent Clp endopeptidase proteolytic subunit ClpP